MFLKIENPGVCPLEGFIILGLSTARADESLIGQFGTGNKHAVNVLLRHAVEFVIYRGTEKLTFFTVPKRMNDINYQLVCYRIGNGAIKETGMCLEHGALDWTDIDMALRELVSNAIDASESPNDVVIELTDNARAKSGVTRVFVEATQQVKQFYNELYDRFLNFDERVEQTFLSKTQEGPAKIYRKGVLVTTLKDKQSSVFEYNLGEELKIDEPRNLSEYAVKEVCADALGQNRSALKTVLPLLTRENDLWEARFSRYDLKQYGPKMREMWKQVWQECFGQKAYMCLPDDAIMVELIRERHPRVRFVPIHASEWYYAMRDMDIPCITQLYNELDNLGLKELPATSNAQATLDKVWGWLEELELTEEKQKPEIKCFEQRAGSETVIFGRCANGKIYLNVEHDTNTISVLEELSHYISDCKDFSRGIQEFIFKNWEKTLKFVFE